MKILVVIPAHNEAHTIAQVVSSVKLSGYDVYVIDDGSTDQTADLARQAGAKVISTNSKSGKGKALRLGFQYALEQGYDAVITLDGDGQHDPSDIAHFVEAFAKTKASIINGNRMQNPQGMPALRLLTNKFMSWMISRICKQNIRDTQCGYRLVATNVLRSITLESNDFEIETELLVKASRKDFIIESVGIKTIYRDEKSKIRPIKDTIRFIRFISRAMADQ